MGFRFGHVLIKYEKSYQVVRTPNEELVNGRVVENSPITENLDLVVLPLRPKQLQEYEGGTYTTQDKKVYQREGSIMPLKEHDVILDNKTDEKYEIREKTPWLDFADFSTFVAKRVVVE